VGRGLVLGLVLEEDRVRREMVLEAGIVMIS